MASSVERGACRVCGDDVPIDGEHAIERFGDVLCRECSSKPVAFVAECDNQFCEFEYRVDETEFNRGHAKMRAQQEANSHENFQRVMRENPMHNTTVREVEGE